MTTYETSIVFECCGHEITTTGPTPSVGKHDEYCLHCETNNPETTIESEQLN